MKRYAVIASLLAGALFATGCASKKYVRNTVAPVQQKVDQVAEQTTQNAAAIEKTRTEVNQVDERAQAGISGAKEQAAAADQHALTAGRQASDAMSRANQAAESADKANRDLRELAANIDNYKLQSSVSILFKFNRSTLNSDAARQLDQVAAEAQSQKRFVITVEGFTDAIGSTRYNLALSQRRAETVVRYLVSRYDIPVYRIHLVGLGKDKPVATGRTAAARAQNRRVEVKVLSLGGLTPSLTTTSSNPVMPEIPAGNTPAKQ